CGRVPTSVGTSFSEVDGLKWRILTALIAVVCLILLERNSAVAQAKPSSAPVLVREIVRQIDARNIEATIRKLVSFGTRNTLSVQDNPRRGIGAARDWLFAEFSKLRTASGGRLSVEMQS